VREVEILNTKIVKQTPNRWNCEIGIWRVKLSVKLRVKKWNWVKWV
jgi:hypothetical protein